MFGQRFFHSLLRSLASFAMAAMAFGEERGAPSGDAVIRAPAGASEIVITTTPRLAGAIHSLTWSGREFIDSADHGRQLQTAWNLDLATPITAGTFNPTEAGSRDDGAGAGSSSRLLFLRATGNALQTVTQPAFWLKPGEDSGGQPAKNTTVLSDHLVTKRVQIGYGKLPNVIRYDVTVGLPVSERHRHFVCESLTGYMPPEFAVFERFDVQTGELEPISDGPGENPDPVVFSVTGGSHAMGIYAPPQKALHQAGPTYGRFRFAAEKVVKWNCVFRITNDAGIAAGDYPFRMFVIVGDRFTVAESMRALHREFEPLPP